MYILQVKDHFGLRRPTLEHSVTHNYSTISQDLLKII